MFENHPFHFQVGDATNTGLASKSVNLVLASPSYTDRRSYGTEGMKRKTVPWVNWMIQATIEGLRVSTGPVIWVCNGKVADGKYNPAVEGLIWEAYKLDLNVEHPLIWSKNSAPNRKNWWCNGWEYIVAFYPAGWDHYFDWKAVATPQKFKSGGGFRQRHVDGSRKIKEAQPRNEFARPYDIIRATVGGGHMGHPAANENEAPFPESLVHQIIPALTRPNDIVLDPFSGSGTTVDVAVQLGRRGLGIDMRESQITLGNRRLHDRTTPPPQQQTAA